MAARKSNNVTNADVSNKTVIAVLVVVILVSVVSLAVYMDALGDAEPTIIDQAHGEVSLVVMDPPVESEPASEGGEIELNVVEPSS